MSVRVSLSLHSLHEATSDITWQRGWNLRALPKYQQFVSGADEFIAKRHCNVLICSLGQEGKRMFTEHGLPSVMVNRNESLAETQVGVPVTSEEGTQQGSVENTVRPPEDAFSCLVAALFKLFERPINAKCEGF